MHQPSILKFFGSQSSKKETENISKSNDTKSPKKNDVKKINNLLTFKEIDNTINNLEEINPPKNQKKRKTMLNSDSDSKYRLKISKSQIKIGNDSNEHNAKKLKEDDSNVITAQQECDIVADASDEEILEIINPSQYNPTNESYNLVKDACWKAKQKVPYLALTKTFEGIEATTKRLEKTRILSNFMRSVILLSPDDLLYCVYLCLNRVAPEYEGMELGIGDTVIMKALTMVTGVSVKDIKKKMNTAGDLGKVAYDLPNNQKLLHELNKLTISAVFRKLKDIAELSGKSAQTTKVKMIMDLLRACSKCETKYLVRGLCGKLRIQLAEQTVLAALGQAATLTQPDVKKMTKKSQDLEAMKSKIEENTALIKTAFCEYPNYDVLIQSMITHGVSSLPEHCSIFPSVPIKPMLAHPSKGVTEIFQRFEKFDFTCEYKYDGERAQIHVFTNEAGERQVRIFSRNQENNTTKFPDIVSLLNEMLAESHVESCIIDSEAVAWDRETQSILPFQVLSTRKRKDVSEGDIKVQVCIYAFDIIYFNGQSLIRNSFRERRDILRKNFTEKPGQFMLSTSLDSTNTDAISEFLEQSIRDKCEGLMIKTLDIDATYEISKRSHNWLKLKKDYLDKIGDTVDLVVIGASYGTGKRANKYGTFLLACYDTESEQYQTICKLGTGFSDEDLDKFYNELKDTVIRKPDLSYDFDKSCKPDCWFEAKFVWEIKAADLSISPDHKAAIGLVDKDKGISLRFPRFIRVREDKKPENSTLSRQIAEMYRNQDVIKNSTASTVNPYEDDEYY